MKEKKIILTGACGFLGKEVYKLLSNYGYNITAISHKSSDLSKYTLCDLSKPAELVHLLEKIKPEIVINLAAKVSFEEQNISELYGINILCPSIISYYCAINNTLMVQASSIMVHGNDFTNFNLNTPYRPDSSYGKSKLFADNLVVASNCRFCIVRFGGIFGYNGPKHLGLNKAIDNAINGELPSILGRGVAKRNYIYVKDAAQAIIKCVDQRITGVYYLGGEVKTIKGMLTDICEVFIPDRKPEHIEGEETGDQIIENSDYFNITPFRAALEQIV